MNPTTTPATKVKAQTLEHVHIETIPLQSLCPVRECQQPGTSGPLSASVKFNHSFKIIQSDAYNEVLL